MKSVRFMMFTLLSFMIINSSLIAEDLLLKDKQLLVTLGNSITQAGENPGGYVDIMRKVLDTLYPERTVYIVNVGISGHKSTDMNERFQRDVLQYKPDWLTISVGVNDVWHGFYDGHTNGDGPRGIPLKLYMGKVSDMVKRANAQNIKVAIFTATVIKENLDSPENKKLEKYNKALRRIAKKYKCLLVDMDKACRDVLEPQQKPGMSDRGILTNDGVHMLPDGNWLMAKTALMTFGVPKERLNLVKPDIEKQVAEYKKAYWKNLSRYAEANHEVDEPREDEKRIVFYGSSSVDGWNLSRDFPKVPFLNRGISGESTRQMVTRFRQDVVKLKPHAVILFFGSCNDIWLGKKMPPAETESNMIEMARMAERAGIKLAFGANSPTNDYIPGKDRITSHPLERVVEINIWTKEFCKKNGYVYVDFYSPVVDSNGKLKAEYSNDGMHCNAEGYAQWKPQVIKALKKLGAWPDDE